MSWFTDLFAPKKKTPMKKPVVKPKEPSLSHPVMPLIPAGLYLPDIGSKDYVMPTREQMLNLINAMIEGSYKVLNGPYKTIRETHGRNRSPRIDNIIKRQGGDLGEPYCAYGVQEILDEVCAAYKVPRKLVSLPEGGGTQSLWSKIKNMPFRVARPVICGWAVWYYNDSKGHIGWTLSQVDEKGRFLTFEFNTDASDQGEVVRDGQGAGRCERNINPTGKMKVRGYIDCYQPICQAIISYRRTLGL